MRQLPNVTAAGLAVIAALLAPSARAQDAVAPAPTPAVAAAATTVLDIQAADAPPARLTLADLEALPRREIVTHTPWHDGKVRFEGVPLATLFARFGLRENAITVEALDGYVIEFPAEDARTKPVILAYKADGKYMAVRDKGPLFIIYDFDSSGDLNNDTYYSRAVWQVRSMRAH